MSALSAAWSIPDQARAVLAGVEAVRAGRSLRAFTRAAWPILEPATPFIPGWHIDAITDHLEAVTAGHIRRLVINLPPRHMKSLLVSVCWPCWEWIEHAELRWLFASYDLGLSVRDSLKCRRLIQSPWYQARWGDHYRLVGDANLKSAFENDKGGYRMALSVGSGVTGHGGDRLVLDDPHNAKYAESDAVREATLTWVDEAWSTRVNNPKTAARVVVMQRLHDRDTTGHLLAKGGWEHLCLPARWEGKPFVSGWTPPGQDEPIADPRQEQREPLWLGQYGEAELAELERDLGSYGTAGQLQQRPSPLQGGILKSGWWRYWDTLPPLEQIITSWDLAFKGLEDSRSRSGPDLVVGQCWGQAGANVYLLDQVSGQWSFTETIQALRAFVDTWPQATAHLIEDKANGPAVMDSLRNEISGIIAVEPAGGKIARAMAVQPKIEAGNVWLPNPARALWVGQLVERAALFPNVSPDDEIDTLTQAVTRLLIGQRVARAQSPLGRRPAHPAPAGRHARHHRPLARR